MPTELDRAIRLAIAALIGLGIGLEREWSGHTTGPNARFAGLRTFFCWASLGAQPVCCSLANTLLKLGLAVALGKGHFRRVAATGLAVATFFGLVLL